MESIGDEPFGPPVWSLATMEGRSVRTYETGEIPLCFNCFISVDMPLAYVLSLASTAPDRINNR